MSDEFRKIIASRGSPTAIAALDAWHAALWLLAVGEIPQSLAALHHATELALKGLLEEVHVALTDSDLTERKTEIKDYECLKHLLSAQFQSHVLGKTVPIPNRATLNNERYLWVEAELNSRPAVYDPEKTICFMPAATRVNEMLGFDPAVMADLAKFNKTRNDIVHAGADPSKNKDYLEILLTAALPFLAQFYHQSYSTEMHCWIDPDIARELLDVAPVYLREEPGASCLQILYTFRHAWRWTYRFNFGRTIYLTEDEQRADYPSWKYDECRERFVAKHVHSNDYPFGERGYPSINCRICAEDCLVVAEPEWYEENGERFLSAVAVYCPGCGLEITCKRFPTSRLAALHVGPITKELIGDEEWKQVLRDLAD